MKIANLLVVVALIVGLVGGYFTGVSTASGGATATVTKTETTAGGATVTVTTTVNQQTRLSGSITIDGSSTVYPITEAAAEGFMKEHPAVSVTVGISGTGGGFKRFIIGETDINDASRPILRSEDETARSKGVRWVEVPIAIDGLVVVVNRANTWVDCLTISELQRLWKPDSTVRTWRDLRTEWPDEPITLYGPGPDSGTFDYFTERVVGKLKSSRTDYVASEDDNVLVAGVEGERNALGYFGYAYYPESKDRIRAVPIRDDAIQDSRCLEPTDETVAGYQYPLSRPLFIYVNLDNWEKKPELRAFVIYYLKKGEELARKVSYTPLPAKYYQVAAVMLEAGIYGGLYQLSLMTWRDAGPH
ncbi:MAG: PstS family phosphate ABC transporter substrate-binding protein [Nitrososphaerota archaeon]